MHLLASAAVGSGFVELRRHRLVEIADVQDFLRMPTR